MALRQNDAVGLLALEADAGGAAFIRPSQKPSQFGLMLHHLQALKPAGGPCLADLLERTLRLIHRRSIVLLFSDLLEPADSLTEALQELRFLGHECLVFHVLDRDETEFPFTDGAVFEDLESGTRRTVTPQAVRQRYLERFHAFMEQHREQFRALEMPYCLIETHKAPWEALVHVSRRAEADAVSIAFFYPLAWLGALAVAVPIWLHLRRREDPNLVRFSALQFLDDQPAARQRRLWPHELAAAAAATARPAAAGGGLFLALPGVSRARDPDQREPRLYPGQHAQPPGRRPDLPRHATRLSTSCSTRALRPRSPWSKSRISRESWSSFGDSRQEAIERLQQLEASYQRGSYLAAFRLADRLLRQSLGEQRHIVLLGDSQENQWIEGRSVPPFLENVDVTLPDVAVQ